jgi:hypothetical protein
MLGKCCKGKVVAESNVGSGKEKIRRQVKEEEGLEGL